VSASQEHTVSGRSARVYTAHRGWLGVVTGISAASTGGVLLVTIMSLGWCFFSTTTVSGYILHDGLRLESSVAVLCGILN